MPPSSPGCATVRRDVVEWMFPPLWPWKVIMLPARGPRPKLKGESQITLRLMDDVEIPQLAQTYGPGWHFFGHPQNESYHDAGDNASAGTVPQLTIHPTAPVGDLAAGATPQPSYAMYVSRPTVTPAPGTIDVPGMPMFVLTTGTMLSVSGYGYQDNRITYTLASGGSGVISSDEVDWPATTRLNAQRGVRVTLHFGHTNMGSGI